MKKRVLVGALALTTVLSLVGCGKKDPQELVNEANANLEKYSSVTMDVVGDAGVKIAMEGMSMDLGVGFDMSVISNTDVDNLGTFVDGKVSVIMPGMSEEVEAKSYMVKENGVYRTYTFSNDSWTYSDTEITKIDDETKEKIEKACEGKGTYTLREDTEKVNDKECYVVDYELTAAEMIEVIEALDEENQLNEVEEAATLLEKVKESGSKAGITIYISKKDVLPVKYEINLNDFVKSMLDVVMDFVAEQKGIDAETTEMFEGMKFEEITFNLAMTVSGMSEDVVTVPGDVKLNATAENDYFYDYEDIEY